MFWVLFVTPISGPESGPPNWVTRRDLCCRVQFSGPDSGPEIWGTLFEQICTDGEPEMGFERTSARSGWLRVPAFSKELVVLGLVFSLSRLAHDIGLFADRVGNPFRVSPGWSRGGLGGVAFLQARLLAEKLRNSKSMPHLWVRASAAFASRGGKVLGFNTWVMQAVKA